MALMKSSQLFRTVAENFLLVAVISLMSSGLIPQVSGVDLAAPHATFYGGSDTSGTNNGACGYGNNFAFGYGTMTTALSQTLFNNGYTCGACFAVTCTGSPSCYATTIVVTATNLCPQGSYSGVCDYPQQHFDLSQPAFAQLAPSSVGVVNVNFQRVTCQRTGGIKFNIQGHTYFMQVLVYNVGGRGDVSSLSVKGTNTAWIALTRGWGQNYNTAVILDGQALSFTVTTGDGASLISWNAAGAFWQYGQTFEGLQF